MKAAAGLGGAIVVALAVIFLMRARSQRISYQQVNFGEQPSTSLPKGSTMSVPAELDGARLTAPPEIAPQVASEFADMLFHVTGETDGKGAFRYRARGLHRGKPVGFELLFAGRWEEWTPKGLDRPLYQSVVALRSAGAASDGFLQAMAELYNVSPTPKSMARETMVGAIALEGNPHKTREGVLKLKLFFGEEEREAEYGELMLTIDLQKSRLAIIEKDPTYRAAIVRWLEKGTP